MDELSELEIELLAAVAEHEEEHARGIGRATLAQEVGLEFPDFVRVLFHLRDCGYLVVERDRLVSDSGQTVLLTHKGADRLEAERAARLRVRPLYVRPRLSGLAD